MTKSISTKASASFPLSYLDLLSEYIHYRLSCCSINTRIPTLREKLISGSKSSKIPSKHGRYQLNFLVLRFWNAFFCLHLPSCRDVFPFCVFSHHFLIER